MYKKERNQKKIKMKMNEKKSGQKLENPQLFLCDIEANVLQLAADELC